MAGESMAVGRCRILLTGANGFIGRRVLARLLSAGHSVRACSRRPDEMGRCFPSAENIGLDFRRATSAEAWLPYLKDIQIVINCAGVLSGPTVRAVHERAPAALFEACLRADVRRVIHISAISADPAADTEYARTKSNAEASLKQLPLEWIILRPSLVYGRGAFGGTALLRGIAALPWLTPLPGRGEQRFSPIHIDDLVQTILGLVESPSVTRCVLEPVGPEVLSLREIVSNLRRWMGLPPARLVAVPIGLVRFVATLSEVIAPGPFGVTALKQLEFGNAGAIEPFAAVVGFRPKRMNEVLEVEPANLQDSWHARLFFLRPGLRLCLGVFWIASGVIGFFADPALAAGVLAALDLPADWALGLKTTACLIDVGLGVLVLARVRPALLALLQITTILAYSIVFTLAYPVLWQDPFGPLVKNLVILAAVAALAALEVDR